MIIASVSVLHPSPGVARMQFRGPFRVFRWLCGRSADPSAGDRSQSGVSCLVTGPIFSEP